MATTLRQLITDQTQVFHEQLNIQVAQDGVAPQGRLSIAVLRNGDVLAGAAAPTSPTDRCLLLRENQHFFVHASKGLDLIVLSVDQDQLLALGGELMERPLQSRWSADTNFELPAPALVRLCCQLQRLLCQT